MLRSFLCAAILLFCLEGRTQQLSDLTMVSLLTCGPGQDLYSTFGHTAIQIWDPATGTDKVYNYGTFDFDTPNFYLKFARGQLNYILSVTTFEGFMRSYQYEGRWVYRQQLLVSQSEANELYRLLEENARRENREYKYDFFYDNCSTRPRDMLEKMPGETIRYPGASTDTVATFRSLIDLYLQKHYWSRFGIYLALGVPCDRKAGFREKMFLPDYLKAAMADAFREGADGPVPIVERGSLILPEHPELTALEGSDYTWMFWVIAIISISGTFLGNAQTWRWWDMGLFFIAGLLGVAITLLWFATDHSATKWNLNLLWATPTWLYCSWLLIRKKPISAVFKWHAALLFFTIVAWMWLPQRLHPACVPIIITLMARSWAWQKLKFQKAISRENASAT